MYVRNFTLLALAIPAWVDHPPIGSWRAGDEPGVTASWAVSAARLMNTP